MFKQENPNFVASKYAPNPQEVSYWIDLTADSSGNVIKSYTGEKWIPLNRDANVDQWSHIREIVESVGLTFDRDSDIIYLPSLNNNNYFKGNNIVEAIDNGDTSVRSEIRRVDGRIDTTNNRIDTTNNNLSNFFNYIIDENGSIKEDIIPDKELSNYYTKVQIDSQKGVANGFATLGSAGKVPESQLPSYVDDVLEFENMASFPVTGEAGKIYVALNTNLVYRWSGSIYVEISPSIALGETANTAYPGNLGKATTDKLSTYISDTEALINSKISGQGVADIQVVSALPETPNDDTLYIVIPQLLQSREQFVLK